MWLDYFLDNKSKILFSIYHLGVSKVVQEAIKSNGNICINFIKRGPYKDLFIFKYSHNP